METAATPKLNWLYCLALVASLISSIFGSSGWVGLAVGQSPMGWLAVLTVLPALLIVYRIRSVIRYPATLNAFVTGRFVKLLRLISIAMMLIGVIGSLGIVLAQPIAIALFGDKGDVGVAVFGIGLYAFYVSSPTFWGVLLFEISRLIGFEKKAREDSAAGESLKQEDKQRPAVSLQSRIKNYALGNRKKIILIGIVIGLAAYLLDPTIASWKEEVKLSDGRVIIVKQEKKKGASFSPDAWVTFNLPEFSQNPIVWHETLVPMILNIDSDNLYIVGITWTGADAKQYGCPKPFYVAYIWIKGGGWQQIPIEKIPKSIYAANMVLFEFPGKDVRNLTIDQKNSEKFNGDHRMSPYYKFINLAAPGSCD